MPLRILVVHTVFVSGCLSNSHSRIQCFCRSSGILSIYPGLLGWCCWCHQFIVAFEAIACTLARHTHLRVLPHAKEEDAAWNLIKIPPESSRLSKATWRGVCNTKLRGGYEYLLASNMLHVAATATHHSPLSLFTQTCRWKIKTRL